MTKVTLNKVAIAKLKKNVKTAFNKTNDQLDESFRNVIESPYAFSDLGIYRDIVDTGRLRDSQHYVVVKDSEDKIEGYWLWNPVDPETGRNYAGDVYVGFISNKGNWIEGRNWPQRGVKSLGHENVFKENVKATL